MDWKKSLVDQKSLMIEKKKNFDRIKQLLAKHKQDSQSLTPDERLFLANEIALRQDQIKQKMDETK